MTGPIETCPDSFQDDSSKKSRRTGRTDEVASIITGDTLIVFRKRFFFPNDLIVVCPRRSDRAHSPPPGFLTIYEMSLCAGLRFPISPEMILILSVCEVCLTQFSCRALTIVMGLIAFFRDRGATLTPDFLSKICKFTCDAQGRVTCRSRLLDFQTRDPPKNWSSKFFFVKNEWHLLEKWGKLKELSAPLHVGEEDILRVLNFQNVEDLRYETRFINKKVSEDFLFKVGLSIHPGRSHAVMLKKSSMEVQPQATKRPMPSFKESRGSPSKKKKSDEVTSVDGTCRDPSFASLLGEQSTRVHIPEEVLRHSCTGRQQAEDLISKRKELDSTMNAALDAWNLEFVKVKYLHGEYKRRYFEKMKEVSFLDSQLAECRTEMSAMATSFSLKCQEVDRTHCELIEARSEVGQTTKEQKTLHLKVSALESENHELQARLSEVEARTGLKAVEDFKNSTAFKSIIQDHVQKAIDHVYDVEVKGLEQQCTEEGFTRGFLKGVRLVHRKTGASIDGLSESQASGDQLADEEDDSDSSSSASSSSEKTITSI